MCGATITRYVESGPTTSVLPHRRTPIRKCGRTLAQCIRVANTSFYFGLIHVRSCMNVALVVHQRHKPHSRREKRRPIHLQPRPLRSNTLLNPISQTRIEVHSVRQRSECNTLTRCMLIMAAHCWGSSRRRMRGCSTLMRMRVHTYAWYISRCNCKLDQKHVHNACLWSTSLHISSQNRK